MMQRFLGRIDRYGAVLLALAISAVAVAYVLSAYASSSRLHNVIFVAPMAALTVLLSTIVVLRTVLNARTNKDAWVDAANMPEEVPAAIDTETAVISEVGPLGMALMMALVICYVLSISYIGFDVASVVFMILCLWLQGERRIAFILIFSVVYALTVTWLLLHGAQIPAHTLIL